MDDGNKIPIDEISKKPEIPDILEASKKPVISETFETSETFDETSKKPVISETSDETSKKPVISDTSDEIFKKPVLPEISETSKITTTAGNSKNKIFEIIKNIINAAVKYILTIRDDKTLILILISIICLFLDFLLLLIIILKYIIKTINFKSIKNPIIKESPNFNAIITGKLQFGILIGLVGSAFILSVISIILKIQKLRHLGNKLGVIGTCLVNTENSECLDKKEYSTLTLAIYIIICTIIQIPVMIPLYMAFLRKQKFINDLISNINNKFKI